MPKPMDAAPTDGREVRVQWRDAAGVENTSLAHYRSGPGAQGGWWTYVDSDTLKRIEPHAWFDLDEDED
jgi:hypothetical protein